MASKVTQFRGPTFDSLACLTLRFGVLFSALFAFPFFLMVGTRNPVMISLAFILIMGIGGGGMFGPQASYFAELFGPRLRYSGFAFARELGSIQYSAWIGCVTGKVTYPDRMLWTSVIVCTLLWAVAFSGVIRRAVW